jgi:hypothetical protein
MPDKAMEDLDPVVFWDIPVYSHVRQSTVRGRLHQRYGLVGVTVQVKGTTTSTKLMITAVLQLVRHLPVRLYLPRLV